MTISNNKDRGEFSKAAFIREDRVLGNKHLDLSIMYATENFRNGTMISRSIWNEILLYLSMQRQVHKSIEILGIKDFSGKVIVVKESKGIKAKPKIEITEEKKRFWGVRSVEELLERMAIFHLENH
ncbi:MAG: KEOPS complex subunit Cgi121 [Thermoplasmatales archaeon]